MRDSLHPSTQADPAEAEQQPLLAPDASHHGRPKVDPASANSAPPEKIRYRVIASALSFFILGIYTAAIGVLVPYQEDYYHLNDTLISLRFVTPVVGYLVASIMNSTIHARLGRRGIAFIGSTCQLLVTVVVACHPPYAVLLLAFAINGFGAALIDAGWMAWAGALENANTVSGFLHGSYSAGAAVGPYLTAKLLVEAGLSWYGFYWIMAIPSTLQVPILTHAFRHSNGASYRASKPQIHHPTPTTSPAKGVWRHPIVPICAVYLTLYNGAENIVSDWTVTFLLRIRNATPVSASICASSFWAGMALGRITLGSITDRFGERRSVTIYLFSALGAQSIFWLLAPFPISIISITLLGFFLGPLFPTGIVMITRLLPRESHVGAVAGVAAAGQVGSALFPFIVGATAERLGIQALQPFVFALLTCALSCWWCFPRLPERATGSAEPAVEEPGGEIVE